MPFLFTPLQCPWEQRAWTLALNSDWYKYVYAHACGASGLPHRSMLGLACDMDASSRQKSAEMRFLLSFHMRHQSDVCFSHVMLIIYKREKSS
jgi:hypothetical protein